MTTKRETILQAIVSDLGSTIDGANVYRSRTESIRREETPAIIVKLVQDIPDYNRMAFAQRNLQFSVKIFTRGAAPDNLADDFEQAVYAALVFGSRTLGNLVQEIAEVGTYFDIQEGDQPIGITEIVFQVTYRTSDTDLTQ